MAKSIPFPRKDSGIALDERYEKQTGFFDLPPEVRTSIYQLLFDPEENRQLAYYSYGTTASLHPDYYASDFLEPLLTCRQFYFDARLLAFSRTTFVIRNPFTAKDVSGRLRNHLSTPQISSIRSIAFVAEADHFRGMRNWKGCPFGNPSLNLDNLDILLHRSSYWHYLFDFNTIFIDLLRGLEGVRRITYIRNESQVKPHFHTWFNRFVAAILKVDQFERYGREQSNPEKRWWQWQFDGYAQTASLSAVQAKRSDMSLQEYEEQMAPMREALMKSIEVEAYDPDPMSRTGY